MFDPKAALQRTIEETDRLRAEAAAEEKERRNEEAATYTLTREQAISALDDLQARYPGGRRDGLSYRREASGAMEGCLIAATAVKCPYRESYKLIPYA